MRLTRVLLAACLALACTSGEERAQIHFERGDAARAAGQHAAAAIEFRSALEIEPNRADAHYGLALSLLDLGKVEGATWELRETVRLDPANLEARLRFAWLAVAAGETEEALSQAEAIVAADPEDREGRLVLVATQLAREDFDAASAEAEWIVGHWPDEKRGYYNLARARAGQGQLAEAEQRLLKYRELDGKSLAATREVLRFYAGTGQDARAERFLREELPVAPPADQPDLALALADRLERERREAESIAPLRDALEAAPDRIDVRERLVRLLARNERLEEALALVAATEATAAAPQRHRIRGDLLAGAGRFDDALEAYREGLRLDPTSTPLRLREAECLIQLGDLAAGSERIRTLLADHPEDPGLAFAEARRLAMATRVDDAIANLRELLQREPELGSAHFLLGVLELAKGRPARAVKPLEKASERLTGDSEREARRLLAEAYLRVGSFPAAAAQAAPLLADDPGDLRARLILADALLEDGLPGRAEATLQAAPTEHPAILGALARVYARTDRLEEARKALEGGLSLEPDSPRWLAELVWVLLEQGNTEGALERVRVGIQAYPDAAEYPNLLGQIFVRLDDLPAAQRAFRRAIEVTPAFVEAYVNLAQLEAREERFDAATDLLGRALEQEPENATLLHELGVLEYRRGHTEAAIAAFERSLRADPESPVTRAALSRALVDAGSVLPRALEIARAARQSDPSDPEVADALGRVLYHTGLHPAAADQFRAAIDLAPHPIGAYHYRLGLALLAGGDRIAAANELERALAIDDAFEQSDDARRRLLALRDEMAPAEKDARRSAAPEASAPDAGETDEARAE